MRTHRNSNNEIPEQKTLLGHPGEYHSVATLLRGAQIYLN